MKNKTVLTYFFLLFTTPFFAQQALDFDGADDFIQTDYNGIFADGDRTFGAWVYVNADAPDYNTAILDYGLNAPGSRNTFIIHGNGSLKYNSGGDTGKILSDPGTIPLEKWTHVAFTLNNGIGTLFVDGEIVVTKALPGVNTPEGEQTVRIGQRVNGGSIPFNGTIDELKIWDVAKSEEEIQVVMFEGYCSPDENLKLFLSFDDGVSAGDNTGMIITADLSGNGFNGTLNNFEQNGSTSNWIEGTLIQDLSSTSYTTLTSCEPYYWSAIGSEIDSSGVYVEVLPGANMNGCDSIVNLDLTIDLVNNTVTQDGFLLTAEASGYEYQWIDCSTLLPIDGATGQSFEPTVDGEYAVVISTDVCSTNSDCFVLSPLGTSEQQVLNNLSVYPNPGKGAVMIDMGFSFDEIKIAVLNLDGKQIQSQVYQDTQYAELSLDGPQGVYILSVETKEAKRLLRVIKQ
jgi:hypothetical protein